jgi:hypothetical protein
MGHEADECAIAPFDERHYASKSVRAELAIGPANWKIAGRMVAGGCVHV